MVSITATAPQPASFHDELGLYDAARDVVTSAYKIGTSSLAWLGTQLHTAATGPLSSARRFRAIVKGMYTDTFCNYVRHKDTTPLVIRNSDPAILNFPIDSRGKTRLIVSTTDNEEDFLSICWMLQVIHERVSDPRKRVLLTAEVLAKALAYRDLEVGRVIPIPTVAEDGSPTRILYRVDKKFNLWKSFPAFGLIPAGIHHRFDNAPLILYRGSSFSFASPGGPASVVTSLDPSGSGRVPFENIKDELKAWLSKVTKHGVKARAIGNGVGGSLAMYTAHALGKFLSKKEHEPTIAFGPLGVSREVYDQWTAKEETAKPLLELFLTQGDVIPKFGHLFGKAYEMVPETRLSPYHAHLELMMLLDQCDVFDVDIEKENASESRLTCHAWQDQDLATFYKVMNWWLMGVASPVSRVTSNPKNESWLDSIYNATYLGSSFLGFA